ncbi:MAG: cytochrome c-type biogenesis protein CcmH [Gemmatimonadetes bacterium]|nr:cytochrome c-type biogenesis protein CcmH [Gemmatimonadota bacterium]
MTTRRDLLRRGAAAGIVVLGGPLLLSAQQQEPLAGQGEAGLLRDPVSAGRARERATDRDNDEFVKALEHRLQCTCGCTLDIYTCRTTDFTCTYSPQLHKEVLALQDEGKTGDEIIAAFVAKYGEDVLMAPKAEGFNIAGYVVPGVAILTAGAVLTAILRRRSLTRQAALAGAAPGASVEANDPGVPVLPGGTGTPEELARLERELRELDP